MQEIYDELQSYTVNLFYNRNLIDTDIENVEKSACVLKGLSSFEWCDSSYLESLKNCITKSLKFHDEMHEKNKKQLTYSPITRENRSKKLTKNSYSLGKGK